MLLAPGVALSLPGFNEALGLGPRDWVMDLVFTAIAANALQ